MGDWGNGARGWVEQLDENWKAMRVVGHIAIATLLLMAMPSVRLAAQVSITTQEIDGRVQGGDTKNRRNLIQVAVPLLSVAPDSRASGMGDVGVASDPDVNSQHWNLSKYALIDKKWGISLSYIPWLRKLTKDINLAYLAGYYRIDKWQAVSGSLRYFSMGQMNFTDEQGQPISTHNPNEFALDVGYSRKFIEGFSGGVGFRFIRSDLTGGVAQANQTSKAGMSFATDVTLYYEKGLEVGHLPAEMAFGAAFTNIGSRLSYNGVHRYFIPATMRLGGRFSISIDDYNRLSGMLDASKLLVPTPPLYNADGTIAKGKNPDVGVAQGVFQSFADAPGGSLEEFHEVYWGAGLEYWYSELFALRFGYFYEHESKGGRQYFTIGAGVSYNVFTLDASYLIPTAGFNSPMANTVRFSLMVNFNEPAKKGKVKGNVPQVEGEEEAY